MKTRWFVLLVLVLAGAALVQSRQSDADEKKEPTTSGKTAYLNLSYVLVNYQKYLDATGDHKKEVQANESLVKDKKATLDLLSRLVGNPNLAPAERKELEEKIKQLQRDLEDLGIERRKVLAKHSDERLVALYRDIRDVATEYAKKKGFEAVLQYLDLQADSPGYLGAPNVTRKMDTAPLMPLYLAPGLDITKAITKELNTRYKANKGE